MKIINFSYLSFIFLLILTGLSCKQTIEKPSPDLSKIDLQRGDLLLCGGEEFGEITFFITCKNTSRKDFNLAVSLLHSFEYNEAEKVFVKVLDADPNCSMAYWGVAMSIYHSLWFAPSEKELNKGEQLLKIASTIPKTERESDYIEAISAFFIDWDQMDHKLRARNYEKKMEAVYQKYPEDTEAAIFYALALRSTVDPEDMNFTNQRKSGKILETIFPDQPNHPGIAHYIIHNYDYPELAELALTTARRYAEIAPASAHAQHMPSHIFTRLGLWEESINTNLNSASSAVCYAEAVDMQGHWDQEIHAIDYLVYAYLQQGENEKANQQYEYIKSMARVSPPSPIVAYPFAAIPARMALENKNWKEAAKIELHESELNWENYPWQKSILHFARSLGSSNSGHISQSENEIAVLKILHQSLLDMKAEYSAKQVQIQILAAQAWLERAKGNHGEALAMMIESAKLEDQTEKHPVTPGEVLPAKELLGDMYMSLDMANEALEVYEENLSDHPNRFNGLYGAAAAASIIGNKEKAKHYAKQLINLAGNSENPRPEVEIARKILG